MSDLHQGDQELDQLLMALAEGEITSDQQQHLAVLLRDDPAAQERYRQYMLIDAMLRWERPQPSPAVPARRSLRTRKVLAIAGWAAAAVLLIVGGYSLRSWLHPAGVLQVRTTTADAGEPHASGLAVLTRSVKARWASDQPVLAVGSTVAAGAFRLESGLVQLEFYSGATLVVEGPAKLDLLATDRVRCHSGKLRAHVPPPARGFTVMSATADLVDLGTEFGVEVGPRGATAVHVFTGKVKVQEPGTERRPLADRELTAGRGLKLEEGGKQTEIPVDVAYFVSALEVERRAQQAMADRQRQWQRASERLAQDPRVVAYYPFRSDSTQDRALHSANPKSDELDGAIIGCEWVTGRWPGKQALEFKRPGDRVRLVVPGEFDEFTLSAWVRVDALEHRFNALFLTDGFIPGAAHWQINQGGKLRLCVCHDMNGSKWVGHSYDSKEIFEPEQLGQWKHLVTTYDRNAGLVKHYVNGQPAGQQKLRVAPRITIGEVELGNWGASTSGDRSPLRTFNGRMDEFLFLRVALTPEEIAELYATGEPIR